MMQVISVSGEAAVIVTGRSVPSRDARSAGWSRTASTSLINCMNCSRFASSGHTRERGEEMSSSGM